jgi:hypothetical protein
MHARHTGPSMFVSGDLDELKQLLLSTTTTAYGLKRSLKNTEPTDRTPSRLGNHRESGLVLRP